MAKSLSFFLCLDVSQASRYTASPADETPLAGTQMIQIKAHEASATTWQTVSTESRQTCDGKILTWNSKAVTEDACKESCELWGTTHVNANSDKTCGAIYFFTKPNNATSCRLYETCDKCKKQTHPGTTLTRSDQICTSKCVKSDCKWKEGRKTKPDFATITCAAAVCTPDECCDWVPGKEPTTTTTTTTTTTMTTFKCLPARTNCTGLAGRNYFGSCNAGHVCDREGCPQCKPGHHYCSNSKPRYWGVAVCPNTQHCTAKGCEEGVDPDLHLLEQCDCPVTQQATCKAPALQCTGLAHRAYFPSCSLGRVCDSSGCPSCPSGHHYCRKDGPHYYSVPTCPNHQHCSLKGCEDGPEENLLEDYELCDCPQR